jgi:glycosyltransferase involved in cell wall biosynthesis
MSEPEIAVIIPAYNEEKSIPLVVQGIPSFVKFILVVDNNSDDKTGEIATKAGAIVLEEKRKGYGWACLKGIEYLKDKNVDVVVFMDGDFSDYPEELTDFIHHMQKEELDLIIGSRVSKAEKGALTPQQVFGNRLATFLMRIFFRYRFTDLGPFRSIRYKSLMSLNMQDKTYGWTIEMQIKAIKQGLKCGEIPVKYRKRIGKSKVSGTVKGTVFAGIKIIFTILKLRFSK